MTETECDILMKSLAPVIREFVQQRLDARAQPLEQRVKQLEADVERLRTQPKSLDYHGTWQRAVEYPRNAVVTYKSVMWACLDDGVRGIEPGTGPCWQLAQK